MLIRLSGSAYCMKENSVFLPALGSLGELEEVVCFNRFNFLFCKEKRLLLLFCLFIFAFASCALSCIAEFSCKWYKNIFGTKWFSSNYSFQLSPSSRFAGGPWANVRTRIWERSFWEVGYLRRTILD